MSEKESRKLDTSFSFRARFKQKEEEHKSKATVAYCSDCRVVRSDYLITELEKPLSRCNECGAKLAIYPEYPKCKCGNRVNILEDRYCPYCGIKTKTYLGGTKYKSEQAQSG